MLVSITAACRDVCCALYQPAIEPNTAYVVDGDGFPDGRKRLLIHPSHQETVEGWLATR